MNAQNSDAEKFLLSVAFIEPSSVLEKCAAQGITAASFQHPANGLIYARMLALHRDGEPVELATVATEIEGNGLLAELGQTPYGYLVQVTGLTATTATADKFIAQVRDLERRRKLKSVAVRIAEECDDPNSATDSLLADFLNHAQHSADAIQSWPAPISAKALSEKPPITPEVLIETMLYRGGTMLISGPSKAHKTYSMLAASCAIAAGKPWLGFTTTKTSVLYLNLELQAFDAEKRVRAICQAIGISPPDCLHLWNLRGLSITLDWLRFHLPAKIRSLGAGVVVIDPHYKVSASSGMEENSNDSQGQLLTALEGLCGRNGAALMVAHHFAKGDASSKNAIDRASGGGVFARWGDVILTFTPHEEQDAMTVEMALRNFAPVDPFAVRWEHPVWVRDGTLNPAKLKRPGRNVVNSDEDALRALGGELRSFSEWQKAAGMAETTFRRKVRALTESGKVEKTGNFYRAKAA